MRPSLSWLAALCFACGARSEIAGGSGGNVDASSTDASTTDATPACGTPPWILFDYVDGTPNKGIYAMHPDGSSLHPVELDGDVGTWPSISPDGTKLLYVKMAETGETLVLRDLNTHAKQTLVTGTNLIPSDLSTLSKAAISPNNQLVAYGVGQDLRIVSAGGTSDHLLALGNKSEMYGYPVFSTDSSTVFFAAPPRLESIHSDGSSLQALTQPQPTMKYDSIGWGPSLSPDGTRLVVPVLCGVAQLRVVPVASLPGDLCAVGNPVAELAESPAGGVAGGAPAWGPGDVIAYDNLSVDHLDIVLVGANGGASTNITSQITANGSQASNPTWAPGCADL